jgi:hypothetical protein
MRFISAITAITLLTSASFASDADYQDQIDALNKKISQLEKGQKSQASQISAVNKQSSFDNIKFSLDFRNAVDVLDYKDNDTGLTASNPSLLSSRLYLNMMAAPTDELSFRGQLAIYSLWGAHLFAENGGTPTDPDFALGQKDWSGSSKPTDTLMRVKEAYFLYSTNVGEQPVSVSIGRRPSTEGFLANYRENAKDPGSPLAHITNMEVNAAMVMLNFSRYLKGSYVKFVYGRAHTGEVENVYGVGTAPYSPYADADSAGDDENVDFFVMPGALYNDGTYNLMFQWAHILNTKGKRVDDGMTKVASGTADLGALSLVVDGISDEYEFLEESSVFASFAMTQYNPKSGYSLLGSEDSETGSSYWVGAIFPDMITDGGKIGLEYNHGSQYWTPMTWAEDTAIGSKVAVRGDALEAYWNFNLFGVKYLPSQVRYTYAHHDYTPNVKCAGWVEPKEVDITASDLRFAVSYRY